MKDYYKILQVNKEASQEIISKVYRHLAKKYHPDSATGNVQEAEEKFKEISEAYEVLSNEEKRKEYNAELEQEENLANSANSTVSVEDYNALLQHCNELEEYINSYQNNSNQKNYNNSYSNSSNNYNYDQAKAQAESQAYQDAINKAYHDSYINNLKNMGYKIRYKQTFKQKMKNLLALIITFAIVFVILYILWHIPSVKENIKDMFSLTIKNSGF